MSFVSRISLLNQCYSFYVCVRIFSLFVLKILLCLEFLIKFYIYIAYQYGWYLKQTVT